MILFTFFILLLTFVQVIFGQFVPFDVKELLKIKNEIPLDIDYHETLSDCPNKYYKYGGQTLISSIALDSNIRHHLSHYVLLGEVSGDKSGDVGSDPLHLLWKFKAKCVGIVISSTWTLLRGDCIHEHKGLINTIRMGVDRYGEWNKKDGNLTEVVRIVNHPTTADFVLVESKEISFDYNVAPVCLMTKNETKSFATVDKVEIDSKRFGLNQETVDYDWRNISSEQLLSGFYQKFLTLGSHLVPFIIFPDETLSTDVLEWIKNTTKLSFDVKECSTRYYDKRIPEPYVSRFSYYAGRDTIEFIPLNALIQSSKRFYRATIHWDDDTHNCIGSLISDRHVVTTANCLTKKSKSPEKVVLKYNPYNTLEHSQVIQVLNVTIHPEYNPLHFYHDIALIRLNGSVVMSSNQIYPACIPEFEIEKLDKPHRQTGLKGDSCHTYYSHQGCDYNPVEGDQQAVVVVISNVTSPDECQGIYEKIGYNIDKIDTKSQFCSGSSVNLVPNTCQTDIGGSIGRQLYGSVGRYFYFLFGIISTGQDCGCGVPSIATRLSHYRPWLNKEMFGTEESKEITGDDKTEEVTKRDNPLEISVLMKSDEKDACMGIMIDNDAILTVEGCRERVKNLKQINLILSTNETCKRTIKEITTVNNSFKILFDSPLQQSQNISPLNIWPKKDSVPFQLISEVISLENNVERLELFTLYPDLCKELHNITLNSDEFCIETKFETDEALLLGAPVWQHFKNREWNDNFGYFVGLVIQTMKDDKIWVGVVKKFKQLK